MNMKNRIFRKFRISLLLPSFAVFFFMYALFAARDFSILSLVFPLTIATGGLILAVFGLVMDIRSGTKELDKEGLLDIALDRSLPVDITRNRSLRVWGYLLGLYLGIWLIGFKISITLFFILFLKLEGRMSWLVTVGLTASAILVFFFGFQQVLTLYWPEGLIGQLLQETLPWLF